MIQGKIITLRTAKVEERKLIFDMGMKTNILTYSRSYNSNLEDFLNDYNESYFDDRDSSVCGGMMICLNKISVGFISYGLIDCGENRINPLIMELDVWLDGEECCGKGMGSDAVLTLSDYLHLKYNIHTFIMCPSKTNTRAIRAYEKAGFILRICE